MADESNREPTPLLLRIGMAAGLLGIVAGFIVGWMRLDKISDAFTMKGYASSFLIPLSFAAVAIGCAIVEVVRRDRFTGAPFAVFAAGVGAALAPLLIGVAMIVVVLAILFAIFSEA